MARSPGGSALLAAVLWAGLATPGTAQGGWRQWDVYLRDGTRVEANPLGSPDPGHLSLSVGAFEGRAPAIPIARIDYLAAQTTVGPRREPIPGVSLPEVPPAPVAEDVIVFLDGRRSTGRVTLGRIAFSEGTVTQHNREIGLGDVAYIRFAARHCPRRTQVAPGPDRPVRWRNGIRPGPGLRRDRRGGQPVPHHGAERGCETGPAGGGPR